MFNAVSRSYLSFVNFLKKAIQIFTITSNVEDGLYQKNDAQDIILMDKDTYIKLED
jgi:hypothetical protein